MQTIQLNVLYVRDLGSHFVGHRLEFENSEGFAQL